MTIEGKRLTRHTHGGVAVGPGYRGLEGCPSCKAVTDRQSRTEQAWEAWRDAWLYDHTNLEELEARIRDAMLAVLDAAYETRMHRTKVYEALRTRIKELGIKERPGS